MEFAAQIQPFLLWAINALLAIVVWFVRKELDDIKRDTSALRQRAHDMANDMHQLKLSIARDYPTKADVREAVAMELRPVLLMIESVRAATAEKNDAIKRIEEALLAGRK